ncbi:MAG TPA: hypothetical protein VLS47_03615 [Gallionella sp.]|nr:hypothetical protein [Gallionella sp.]
MHIVEAPESWLRQIHAGCGTNDKQVISISGRKILSLLRYLPFKQVNRPSGGASIDSGTFELSSGKRLGFQATSLIFYEQLFYKQSCIAFP